MRFNLIFALLLFRIEVRTVPDLTDLLGHHANDVRRSGFSVYLTHSCLQHGVKASLWRVHVPRDPLLLNHMLELCHVVGDGQNMDEAVCWPAINLIITIVRKRKERARWNQNRKGSWEKTRERMKEIRERCKGGGGKDINKVDRQYKGKRLHEPLHSRFPHYNRWDHHGMCWCSPGLLQGGREVSSLSSGIFL